MGFINIYRAMLQNLVCTNLADFRQSDTLVADRDPGDNNVYAANTRFVTAAIAANEQGFTGDHTVAVGDVIHVKNGRIQGFN